MNHLLHQWMRETKTPRENPKIRRHLVPSLRRTLGATIDEGSMRSSKTTYSQPSALSD